MKFPTSIKPEYAQGLQELERKHLRDQFAIAALQSMCMPFSVYDPADESVPAVHNRQNVKREQERIALHAYQMADAMMAERNKSSEQS